MNLQVASLTSGRVKFRCVTPHAAAEGAMLPIELCLGSVPLREDARAIHRTGPPGQDEAFLTTGTAGPGAAPEAMRASAPAVRASGLRAGLRGLRPGSMPSPRRDEGRAVGHPAKPVPSPCPQDPRDSKCPALSGVRRDPL